MAGIVATIWPATQTREKLIALYDNWVRILRINCSHATHEWMDEFFNVARKVEKDISNTFAFLLDTKGPGIRTGELEEPVSYEKDEKFKIVVDKNLVDDPKTMFIDYPFLLKDVQPKRIIKVDSGLFDVKVIKKHKLWIKQRLVQKGM